MRSEGLAAMGAAALLVVVAIVGIFSTTIAIIQSAEAQRFIDSESNFAVEPKAAPAVVSGDNIYIAWWTNNTEDGNLEVMFRASNDGGATFGDRINLSNTSNADSGLVEIAAEGDNVIVTWWEGNQTSTIPVARISNDAGETFGPLLMLGANGTLGSAEEAEEEIGITG